MSVDASVRWDLPRLDGTGAPPRHLVWLAMFVGRRLIAPYETHIQGMEHIPPEGPVILASNHIGYLDGPMLLGSSRRPVHALVKESMFVGPVGFGLLKVGQIRVDRYHVDPEAVKKCLAVLRHGDVVAIYPEGARGRGDVAETRGGAAYLALVTGAPVVPVACLGTRLPGASTESKPPKGNRLDLVVGRPIRFDAVPWPRTKQAVAAAQLEIQQTLAEHVKQACEATGQTLPEPPVE